MATRIKPTTDHLYEQDFYAWSKAQADLLRAGRFSDLDLEHLIEEVDDLGEALKRSVRSRLRTIIEHLLKLEHSPAQAPRGGWYDTILTRRSDLLDELTPSIRREVEPTLGGPLRQDAGEYGHVAAQARRERRCRRPATGLPLQPRSDHRRLAALSGRPRTRRRGRCAMPRIGSRCGCCTRE